MRNRLLRRQKWKLSAFFCTATLLLTKQIKANYLADHIPFECLNRQVANVIVVHIRFILKAAYKFNISKCTALRCCSFNLHRTESITNSAHCTDNVQVIKTRSNRNWKSPCSPISMLCSSTRLWLTQLFSNPLSCTFSRCHQFGS